MSAESVSPFLKVIFDISLNNCCLPNEWRKATVISLHKSGKKCEPANYRPISLTSVCCKIFEQIICKYIRKQLDRSGFFYCKQYGFRPSYSCDSALLTFTHNIIQSLENNSEVDAVALDFQKAFDVVPHDKLMSKFSELNIDKTVILWVQSFLQGRTQCVMVNGAVSRERFHRVFRKHICKRRL